MASEAKVYVPVLAAFGADGKLTPRALVWEDGTRYTIDRVLDMRPAAAQKAGGQGDRYTVRIGGKESYLFFEHGTAKDPHVGRWFVERREEAQRDGT